MASVHHVSEFCHHLPSASKVAESGGSHSDSPQQRCPEENQLTWQNAARSAINFSISKVVLLDLVPNWPYINRTKDITEATNSDSLTVKSYH